MKSVWPEARLTSSRVLLAFLLCTAGLLLGFMSLAEAQDNARATAKIAPWVSDRTADGAVAEFLIVLAEQADLSGADALRSKEEKGRYVRDALWNTAQRSQGPALSLLRARGVEHRAFYIVNFIWAKGSMDDAMALAARPEVARIEGNPLVRNQLEPLTPAAVKPNGPHAPSAIEPGISYSRAPEVWASGFTGQGIVIGAQDTGYRWSHAAVKGKYRGWNGVTADHNYNWHDSIHSGGGVCGPNSPQPCDDNGHGTHTIGTAVGDDGSANQIGMAPGAKWIGCRNMNQGNGTPATYLECLEFFLAPYPVGGSPAEGDPDRAPHITTNSWSCPPSEGCSLTTLQQAFEAQRAAGIMTVVSAGNSGSGCSSINETPAIYESTYTIAALNTGTDGAAGFSSRGPVTIDGSNRRKPDLSAPGTNTRSAWASGDTDYVNSDGTSMAVPHVAGAAALLLSARPALIGDVASIRASLSESAVHLSANACDGVAAPPWPNNTYGYGRLDAKAAVDLVLQLTDAVSRKHHAGVPFGVSLLAPGAVECRQTNGSHTFVFTFSGNVTRGSAAITAGSGAISGTPVFAGNTMTVDLTGVADAQALTVELTGVGDDTRFLPPTSFNVGMLVGDTNGDGVVNVGDAQQTRVRSGASLGATTFRADVNVDGSINSGDAFVVRARSGNSVQ